MVIVLNKIDVINEDDREKYKKMFKEVSEDVFLISAATRENITELMYFIEKKIQEIPKPESNIEIEEDTEAYNNDDSEFEVIKLGKGVYSITGGKILRHARLVDIRNTEQVIRFQNILKSMAFFLHHAGHTVCCFKVFLFKML